MMWSHGQANLFFSSLLRVMEHLPKPNSQGVDTKRVYKSLYIELRITHEKKCLGFGQVELGVHAFGQFTRY